MRDNNEYIKKLERQICCLRSNIKPISFTYQADSSNFPNGQNDGSWLIVTSDGTSTGDVLETWVLLGGTWLEISLANVNQYSLQINETIEAGEVFVQTYPISGLNSNKPTQINFNGLSIPLGILITYNVQNMGEIRIHIENQSGALYTINHTITINN